GEWLATDDNGLERGLECGAPAGPLVVAGGALTLARLPLLARRIYSRQRWRLHQRLNPLGWVHGQRGASLLPCGVGRHHRSAPHARVVHRGGVDDLHLASDEAIRPEQSPGVSRREAGVVAHPLAERILV